ncbi:unnamed protein product [Caenorhabditis sp. 36 PRJEB53466]|nr:unnamed protein product [Caenorhabditis sp. 36 PRJEB53466]
MGIRGRLQKQKKDKRSSSSARSKQRSSSRSNASSQTSERSQSSVKSKVARKKSKRTVRVRKLFEATGPRLSIILISWIQSILIVYVIVASIYNLFWSNQGSLFVFIAMLETCACFLEYHAFSNCYTGACCTFLAYQYVLLVCFFSTFLQSDYDPNDSFWAKLFGLAALTLFASLLHFAILIQSIELIGVSQKRNDYVGQLIVESKETRRRDVFTMVAQLIQTVCSGEEDIKVNLMVADETGKPMKLSGAGVEAGVNRTMEMRADGRSVELLASNTAAATIHVPKTEKEKKKKPADPLELVNGSIYNKCSKQDNTLSPGKLL